MQNFTSEDLSFDPEDTLRITHTMEKGDCQACGFPPGTPGHLRDNTVFPSVLVPCPNCHSRKMSARQQITGQLQGDLKLQTFDNYAVLSSNQMAYDAVKKWSLKPLGWCTLYGEYGPGKTHLAAAVSNFLDIRAKYFNFPDVTAYLRNNPEKSFDFIAKLERIEVLILDEFDKSSLKMWTREQIQRLFDYRYRNETTCGLMICSNIAPDNLPDESQFIGSRMKTQGFICVEMKGDARPIRNQLAEIAARQIKI